MKMPTKKQLELYKLIHPDYVGLTLAEAASELDISVRAAQYRLANMRKTHPNAFNYEKFIEKEEENISDITQIYKGYRNKAISNDIEWNLTIDDVEQIIQLECHICHKNPTMGLGIAPGFYCDNGVQRTAYNHKKGYKFTYHRLWRYDITKGFNYINCVSICWRCLRRRRLRDIT
jgi:hypothetical protein